MFSLAVSFVISSALTPSASPPEAVWRARAAEREASKDWCEASFYRERVLGGQHNDDDVYRAFLAAYAADALSTARTLYASVHIDALGLSADGTRKLARIKSDLDTVSPLEDVACAPHQPVCGDAIVDEAESCDDGNTDDHDGCSSLCAIESPPPSAALASGDAVSLLVPVATSPAPPSSTPVTTHVNAADHARPHATSTEGTSLLLAGGIAGGAGIVATGAGAAFAIVNDQVVADPSATGADKQRALTMRTASLIAMGFGAVIAAAGGTALALSLRGDGAATSTQ